LVNRIEFKASYIFQGTVWNTMADPKDENLFIEIRDEQLKQVRFSALNLKTGQFLWNEIVMEEPWWISLAAVSENVLFFTVYTDTNNPDKKSIIAFDIINQKVRWWRNDFAITGVSPKYVIGTEAKFGIKRHVLSITDGERAEEMVDLDLLQNFSLIRPLQYLLGTPNFDTVKSFLEIKCNIQPVAAIEYLEYQSLIFVSFYSEENGLANYLYVFDNQGEILLKERIGEQLKGIGADTFFILSGYLIFVKNKRELVSYTMV
jgi:hypothetical protein